MVLHLFRDCNIGQHFKVIYFGPGFSKEAINHHNGTIFVLRLILGLHHEGKECAPVNDSSCRQFYSNQARKSA